MYAIFNMLIELIKTLYEFVSFIIKIPIYIVNSFLNLFSNISEDTPILIGGALVIGLVLGFVKWVKEVIV